MGRWAQRTRQGGSVNVFTSMQLAVVDGGSTDTLIITYTEGGNEALLSAADFEATPSGEVGTFQVVTGTNELTVQFSGDVSGDDDVTYSGNAVGFLTPQTIGIA